ncbi:hypothetical protein QMK38_15800 [Lysinibacillus fusiformis]|nr:hypothetical protein [Lysinibacillus fusiformis]
MLLRKQIQLTLANNSEISPIAFEKVLAVNSISSTIIIVERFIIPRGAIKMHLLIIFQV